MCNCISQLEDKARQQFTSTHDKEMPMCSLFEMSVKVDYGRPRWWTQRVKRGHVNYRAEIKYCPFCGERRG